MKKITAVIVEDELLSRYYLTSLLQTWCSNVDILAAVTDCEQAINAINELKPDIVFLDIQLSTSSGFDVVSGLSDYYPIIIFTTAFGDAALKIIKPSGLLFLQKPIDSEDLCTVINKVVNLPKELFLKQADILLNMPEDSIAETICVETINDCFEFIKAADIMYIESIAERCMINLACGIVINTTSLSLKDCETFLCEPLFCRISNKHIVNTSFVELFCEIPVPYVLLTNSLQLPVAEKKITLIRAALHN